MLNISNLYDFKRQAWVREVRQQIDAARAELPERTCSECSTPLTGPLAPDQQTCGPECSGKRRTRIGRENYARKRAVARANGLKHYAPASARLVALAREAQDAEIARWCAEWRERQRRAVVGRLGVRHAR